MKNRILLSLAQLAFVSVILTAAFTAAVFYVSGNEEFGAFSGVVLVTLVLGLIAHTCIKSANRLTGDLLKPIKRALSEENSGDVYNELEPFIKQINEQRLLLSRQLDDISQKTRTIETIIENMPEGFVLLDEKGRILSANRGALAIFSRDDSFIGRNLVELTRNVGIKELVKTVKSGVPSNCLSEISGRNYQVLASPVENSGAMLLFLDVTEKNRAENIRREFTANVSHELKTPLTVISGYAEMINNGLVKPEDSAQFAGRIKDEASRLLALIDDIIKLSELDERGGHHEFGNVDVHTVARDVIERLSIAAEERGVTVSLKGEGTCYADTSMMDEMLFNLVDNGIKYNKPGGDVTISIQQDNNLLRVAVADTGIGIGNEHIPRVFERFYRVDKSRSKKTGGTGLGLSIVKHIVEYHDGKIDLTSEAGKGTKITIILSKRQVG